MFDPFAGSIAARAERVLRKASLIAEAGGNLDQKAIDAKGAAKVMHSSAAVSGVVPMPTFVSFDSGDFNTMILGSLQSQLGSQMRRVEPYVARRLPAEESARFDEVRKAIAGADTTDPKATIPVFAAAARDLASWSAESGTLHRRGSLELGAGGILADVDAAKVAADAGLVGLQAGSDQVQVVRRMVATTSHAIDGARPGLMRRLRDSISLDDLTVATSRSLARTSALVDAQTAVRQLRSVVTDGSRSQGVLDAVHAQLGRWVRGAAIEDAMPKQSELTALATTVDHLFDDTGAAAARVAGTAAAPAASVGAAVPAVGAGDWSAALQELQAAIQEIQRVADPSARAGTRVLPADQVRTAALRVEGLRDAARANGRPEVADMLDRSLERLYPQVVRARTWKPGVLWEGRTPVHAQLARARVDIESARLYDEVLAGSPGGATAMAPDAMAMPDAI